MAVQADLTAERREYHQTNTTKKDHNKLNDMFSLTIGAFIPWQCLLARHIFMFQHYSKRLGNQRVGLL